MDLTSNRPTPTAANVPTQHLPRTEIIAEAEAIDPDLIYEQGYQAWHAGNYARARINFSWLVMSQPHCWRAHMALAGTLMMEKSYPDALRFYGHAITLDPCHPEPLYQMGICLNVLGEREQAREALQIALNLSYDDPAYSDVRGDIKKMLEKLMG